MSRKKQKSQGKATAKPQSDPWLKWCAPAQGADVQRFLANPEGHLGMGIIDYLDCIEKFYPSEIVSSAQRTISDATKGINLPKLENIKVAHVLDVEDEDGTSLSNIPIFENVITKRLTLFELADNVFSKLERLKAAWPHQDAVERVKNTAKEFVRFLLAVYKMGQEKITQAKALGRIETAAKLEKAYKDFCMIELTGDIDTDAKRLFLEQKITPDEFRSVMRRAFVLDSQATEEINSAPKTTRPQSPTTMTEFVPLLEKAVANSAATNNAVEQIAVGISAANAKIDTLLDWWKDWKKQARHISRENSPTSRIAVNVLKAIKANWIEYKEAPVDTSPILPVENRKPGQKRNLSEFIANMGNNKILNDKSLNEILDVAKKDNETRLDTLKRLLDSMRKNDERHP